MVTALRYKVLPATALVLMAAGLAMAINAPPEQVQGEYAKMLFIHVPSVMAAYVGFAVALLAAIVYLISKKPLFDKVSAAAIEVGLVFTALTLVTGMIWGRPTWGVWWDWGDARMMSTALLFFFYLGYLALRRAIPDPDLRARRSAFFAIIAFVQVPIVHFSVQWFRTLHQTSTIIRPDIENAPIDPVYARTLGVSILAFVAIFFWFLQLRTRLATIEAEAESRAFATDLAGAAVSAPDLGDPRG